jgi:inosine-uridine nucleoside N-ribohydrolase
MINKHPWLLLLCLLLHFQAGAAGREKVIIDQDCAGPAGTDLQSILVMIQSPKVEVLGITVVTGDQWRNEEVIHTLRLLEIIHRTDIPVYPGAVFPLVRKREETEVWQQLYGKVDYEGAWDKKWWHDPFVVPPPPEGQPTTKAADEDAAHFLVRMVHKYPHEITIYEGGPMTNLALAIALDHDFASLAKQLIFMGASLNPRSDDPEFANNPRHEFNIWFDPEAAYIVLRAPWKRIVCTPVDISIKTRLTPEMVQRIASSGTELGRYLERFAQRNYMWDELAAAAWLDPGLITERENLYMSVDLDRGAGYGNTLTWRSKDEWQFATQPVEVQVNLDTAKFYDEFITLMSKPTPAQ